MITSTFILKKVQRHMIIDVYSNTQAFSFLPMWRWRW